MVKLAPIKLFKPSNDFSDSVCVFFLCFCHFPIWCIRSGVLLDD